MPIPAPHKDEDKKDFMDRCMSDDVMVKEYPDNRQRYAICQTSWDKKESKNMGINDIEKRTFDLDEIRIDEQEEPKIFGHAAIFNKLSLSLGNFKERIKPGAFTKTIQESDIRALFNHDNNYVIGRTKNNTLKLMEDNKGLLIEATPPDTQWAKDLLVSLRRKDIDQMSFQFRVPKDRDSWETVNGELIRTLHEVELFDVSPVTFPAYPQTDVSVRSIMISHGIDYDNLSEIMTRFEQGIELNGEDYLLIDGVINQLNSLKPKEKLSIDILKKKLELIAI